MAVTRPTFRIVLLSIAGIVIPAAIFSVGYKRGYTDCWEEPLVRAIYTVTWRAEDADTRQPIAATVNWGEFFEKGAASSYDIRHADGSVTSVLLREKTEEQEVAAFIRAPDHDAVTINARILDRNLSTQPVNETLLIKLRPKTPAP